MIKKLKSWSKGDLEDTRLVKANLPGSNLPPELQERGDGRPQGEHAGIASIYPEVYSSDASSNQRAQAGQTMVSRGPEQTAHPRKLSLGQGLQDGTLSDVTTNVEGGKGQDDMESLPYSNSSGHRDIQKLAEHYKGRSRRLAAAREVSRASNSSEKADVILEHQLMDIDSI